jgi:hypothetical protein
MQDLSAEILAGTSVVAQAIRLGLVLLAAATAYGIARIWLVGMIRRFARRSTSSWDDAFIDSEVFRRLSLLAPAVVAYYGVHLATEEPLVLTIVERGFDPVVFCSIEIVGERPRIVS